jgi:hypothetical protein
MKKNIVHFSLDHPWIVMAAILILVALLGSRIPSINIDTDPENMLPADQPQRVLHDVIKERFNLHDMIVVGMVNETDEQGIFNLRSLATLHELTDEILQLDGVISHDLMSLSTVDNISQEGPGTIRFNWMMKVAPENGEQVEEIRQAVQRLPLLQNTLVSDDGRAAGIYIPIEHKNQSNRIAEEIRRIVAGFETDDEFHITGLPVAEDTFGVEMFKQMALSAPLAGLVIFLMMWIFFRSIPLIVAPMVMAGATVVATMGLLIGMGFTVHIMSSMIPIFLMPIAVVDSVHLLSEFSDKYKPGRDAKQTVRDVMSHLFTPMLYTSITSAVGFASLALTPIPPVQVFGLFVAFGILLAFGLTITFIPAYIALLSPKRLAAMAGAKRSDSSGSPLARILPPLGRGSLSWAKLLLVVFGAVFLASIYGITHIQINDNPVRWFEKQHEIRIADEVLNEHFAGTYNAFLVLNKADTTAEERVFEEAARAILSEASSAGVDLEEAWSAIENQTRRDTFGEYLEELGLALGDMLFDADEKSLPFWEELLTLTEETAVSSKFFQTPEALSYMENLQAALDASPRVGKSNSLATLVKTIYRELLSGRDEDYRLPNSANGVAQALLSFQSSHRPDDLWHMVTPDYRSSALWLQLKSGDNQDMAGVLRDIESFTDTTPLPDGIELELGGLTYINVVWQDEMVKGMRRSLIGSFIIVLLIMIVLFRSFIFGLLAMVPLSFTITFIYGIIGFMGKDYDMPIAVLSSLTLGLSIDFAIHLLERARSLHRETGSWKATMERLFEEPARAISRNALVIAIGFLPLLAAPLVPYKTVGFFLASIMAVSSLVTLILLPALMQVLHKRIFPGRRAKAAAAA